jgi:hypothetical protein
MSFSTITLCVASQRVLIFVRVRFAIDSDRKLLGTPSYNKICLEGRIEASKDRLSHLHLTFMPSNSSDCNMTRTETIFFVISYQYFLLTKS